MKHILFFSIVLSLMLPLSSIVQATSPLIKEESDGWYIQSHGVLQYWVDAKSESCFVVYYKSSVTIMDCEKLKKRDEWKNIITW